MVSFDRVDHDVLLKKLQALEMDERVVALVRRFLKVGKISSSQVEKHRAHKGKQEKYTPEPRNLGVPQGGVLSGLLSNLYLAEFDSAVLSKHVGLVRYADDFVICCKSRPECANAYQLVKELLGPLKVSLHPSPKKTKECVLAEFGVEFLGFRVSPESVRIRGRNVGKFKRRVKDAIAKQRVYSTPEFTLERLCDRLSFKIRGPDDDQLRSLAERGKTISPCRRSWIGFFRIVDDIDQIKRLDNWIRKQVSHFMWTHFGCRVTLAHMNDCGLPSLVNCLWKARNAKPLAIDEA